jgi:hypothetical protein
MRLHFSNYLSRGDAEECVRSNARKITLTPTALKQTPGATIDFLKSKGIKVRVLNTRGRPRRLSKAGVRRILAMRQRGMSYYKISRLTKIPKSTVFDYCRRYEGLTLKEKEVLGFELREAKRLLRNLIKAGLGEEITALARRGYASSSRDEILYILGEIENIVEAYR